MELTTTVKRQVDPSSADWLQYYAAASKRHRRSRREQRLQIERKRRRWRERMMMLASLAFVGALTFVFYAVLTR